MFQQGRQCSEAKALRFNTFEKTAAGKDPFGLTEPQRSSKGSTDVRNTAGLHPPQTPLDVNTVISSQTCWHYVCNGVMGLCSKYADKGVGDFQLGFFFFVCLFLFKNVEDNTSLPLKHLIPSCQQG